MPSVHFYRMATMTSMGCGREAVSGTDFTTVIDEVTCGNCKRSKAFKAVAAEIEQIKSDITAAIQSPPERVGMAMQLNAIYQHGDMIMVEIDGIPSGSYTYIDASAVSVNLATGKAQQSIDTGTFHAAMLDRRVRRVSTVVTPVTSSTAESLAMLREIDDVIDTLLDTADVEERAPFRSRGKVKPTSRARRYRKGA